MKYQNDIDKMNTNRNLFLMSLQISVQILRGRFFPPFGRKR